MERWRADDTLVWWSREGFGNSANQGHFPGSLVSSQPSAPSSIFYRIIRRSPISQVVHRTDILKRCSVLSRCVVCGIVVLLAAFINHCPTTRVVEDQSTSADGTELTNTRGNNTHSPPRNSGTESVARSLVNLQRAFLST